MRNLSIYLLLLASLGCADDYKPSPTLPTKPGDRQFTESPSSQNPNEFRGYVLMNKIVAQRIVNLGKNGIVSLLADHELTEDEKTVLVALLGTKIADGRRQSILEKQANSINTLLWSNLFFSLANKLAQTCFTSGSGALPDLNNNLKNVILQFCNLPSFDISMTPLLDALYDQLLSQDRTNIHHETWKSQILSKKQMFAADRQGWLRQAIYSALFSPEFLINR